MLKKALLTVAVILGVFLVFIATQSPDYSISRQVVVKASPEKLFPYINNSKRTNEWMPWKESDPNVQMNYSGPDEGVGSTASWDSEGQMGTGKAEVIESKINESVKTKLTYTKPFPMTQMAEMNLNPQPDGTVVRWSVEGQNNFIGRIFCFFMNMDKMVGGEFEKGLNKLKSMVESQEN